MDAVGPSGGFLLDGQLIWTHISYSGKTTALKAEDVIRYYKSDTIEVNVQESIGSTPSCSCHNGSYEQWWGSTAQLHLHKPLYTLVFDFDTAEENGMVVMEFFAKILKVLCTDFIKAYNIAVPQDYTFKVAYSTRSSKRWHIQILNCSLVNNNLMHKTILKKFKKHLMDQVKRAFPDLSEEELNLINGHDAGAGSTQWLMYGSSKKAGMDPYELKYIVTRTTNGDIGLVEKRESIGGPSAIRQILSIHRPVTDDRFGTELALYVDEKKGKISKYICKQTIQGYAGDIDEINNTMSVLNNTGNPDPVVFDDGVKTADSDINMDLVIKMKSAIVPMPVHNNELVCMEEEGGDDERLEEDDQEDGGAKEIDELTIEALDDCRINPKTISKNQMVRMVDAFFSDKGEALYRHNKNVGPILHDKEKCIEYAKLYKDFLTHRKYDFVRKIFYRAIFTLVAKYDYASKYTLWFGNLTPLIISYMGYSGLSFY
ncbi:uncharacterized protein LOC119167529 isoform X1 [Rhipicephalus microplus]|uniref:uncharacterized protein LOC119167529 isoform X1 n=1 Tax=Rhipicephalus microplus TaxID=6941 RepID=UPI003F6D623C